MATLDVIIEGNCACVEWPSSKSAVWAYKTANINNKKFLPNSRKEIALTFEIDITTYMIQHLKDKQTHKFKLKTGRTRLSLDSYHIQNGYRKRIYNFNINFLHSPWFIKDNLIFKLFILNTYNALLWRFYHKEPVSGLTRSRLIRCHDYSSKPL